MKRVSTSELSLAVLQEAEMLQKVQQHAIAFSLDFPVKSNTINHLMALKAEGEEKYLTSLQRREIFQNRIKQQQQNLSGLHQAYNRFEELFKSYQALVRRNK
ncbi:MAG: hypothetical protein MUD08_04955 [Cytophagales bacterium]|jgi:hypothetical protein|nr:hypothetical protein [Cytophagales bacterium]